MPMQLTPDSKFKITIGAFIGTVIAAAGFGWKAQSQLASISQSAKDGADQIRAMGEKIVQVETSLTSRLTSFEQTMSDRFTKTAAAEWALRLVVSNPTLKIPDPRDPSRMLSESSHRPESTASISYQSR